MLDRKTPRGRPLDWITAVMMAASPSLGEGELIVGIGPDQRNWDGMGKVVFFLESINGDATPEIVATAHCADCHGTNSGTIQVFDGVADTLSGKHELLWQRYGDSAGDRLGEAAAPCGDIDADGIGDIIVGAPGDALDQVTVGSVYLLSGIDGTEIYRFWGSSAGGRFGARVASLGDMDGDGVPEIGIGAPNDSGMGSLIVISGGNGETLTRLWGRAASLFGMGITATDDFTDDEVPDILVGAPGWSGGRGRALLLDGSAVARGESDLAVVAVKTIDGPNPISRMGFSAAVIGDLDGGGAREIAVGAIGDDAIYLFEGEKGEFIDAIRGRGGGGDALDGFGYAPAAPTGDIDLDGIEDFVVGAPGYSTAELANVGIAHVYSGADLSILRSSQVFIAREDYFGASVGAGDVDLNGDGLPDVLIGIPGYGDRQGRTAFGAIYIDLS